MNGAVIAWLVYVGVVIAALCGWVMNIITIAHSNFNDITGMLVLRVVGIFVAPLGAVLGFF
jgi:hypothetical protein